MTSRCGRLRVLGSTSRADTTVLFGGHGVFVARMLDEVKQARELGKLLDGASWSAGVILMALMLS